MGENRRGAPDAGDVAHRRTTSEASTPTAAREPTQPQLASRERDVRPDGELFCLACSTRLTGRGCKILCPRCGYFEDCSNLL